MQEESPNPNPKGILKSEFRKDPSGMIDVLHKVKRPTENKT